MFSYGFFSTSYEGLVVAFAFSPNIELIDGCLESVGVEALPKLSVPCFI